MNRGISVIEACESLSDVPLSANQLEDAVVLGWCIEFLQAFFLVADDVMDRSKTRRGQPCWYLLPHVKEIAINDSFLLESFVFAMIRHQFSGRPYYTRLLDLFLEVTLQTEIGQLYDLTSQPMDAKPLLERFTWTRYRKIVKYKTAFYTFYLPVACSMVLSGTKAVADYNRAKQICCVIGEYFQVQDDYLDCYGDPKTIGKIGTDIQDNKCSWLVVQALLMATTEQRSVLEDSYGKDSEEGVIKVKALYKTLGLEKAYLDYEAESYRTITGLIEGVKSMPQSIFIMLLKKIYKRKK